MTNTINSTAYHRLALLLGALGFVVVACSDDDDATGSRGDAGSAGTSAGKSNAGGSNGGNGSAGKSTAGTDTGGKSTAGTNNGGTNNGGTNNGGTNNGGTAGSTAMAGDAGMAGDSSAGTGALGGQGGDVNGGAGGDALPGAAGAGGMPATVPDVLDDADFSAYGTGWSEEGDVDASNFKWIHDQEPGLNHWSATAYQVATLQTLDPLPNGTYSFSMEIERAASLNDQHLFARGCKAGEPNTEVTQATDAAGSSGYTKITLSNIEVSSGSCTVGIYTDAPADGWANIDNAVFSLQ
jgi:hypothetical protein